MSYPLISFGTYRLGKDTYQSLEYALTNGYRSIDTASLYQIELSPFLKRPKVIKYMNNNNIIISAHSSLAKGEKFNDPILLKIANKYNKSPAQIMLKWGLQNNFRIIPRSSKKEHILEDINLNFIIYENDMQELNDIDTIHITHPQYTFI